VRDPAILILDEATSSVDNATELAIQKTLAKIGQGRTIITITHRLSLAKQADRILVLKKGTIVEQGTHVGLLQQDHVYANLWKLYNGEPLTHPELIE
jgi:ATP-binding cassette, subfamily B, bacterial